MGSILPHSPRIPVENDGTSLNAIPSTHLSRLGLFLRLLRKRSKAQGSHVLIGNPMARTLIHRRCSNLRFGKSVLGRGVRILKQVLKDFALSIDAKSAREPLLSLLLDLVYLAISTNHSTVDILCQFFFPVQQFTPDYLLMAVLVSI